jgi:hypothetical protein
MAKVQNTIVINIDFRNRLSIWDIIKYWISPRVIKDVYIDMLKKISKNIK